jgi:hypothetical protein
MQAALARRMTPPRRTDNTITPYAPPLTRTRSPATSEAPRTDLGNTPPLVKTDWVERGGDAHPTSLPSGDGKPREAPKRIGALERTLTDAPNDPNDPDSVSLGGSGRARSTGVLSSKPKETLESRYPLKSDGMTVDDVRRAASQIDADRDGKISPREVAAFGELGRSRGFADKDARELFRRMEAGAALLEIQGEQPGRPADKKYLDGGYTRELKKLNASDADIDDVKKALSPQATTTLGDDAKTPDVDELDHAYADQAKDPKARKTFGDLASSPGFARLDAGKRQALLKLADGTSPEYSDSARTALDAVMADPKFAKGSAADQQKLLEDFITKQPHLPSSTAGTNNLPTKGVPYKILGDQKQKFPQKLEIEIDGRKIPLNVDSPGPKGTRSTPDEVADAIARTPKANRDLIKSVNIAGIETDKKDGYPPEKQGVPGGGLMSAGGDGGLTVWPTDQPQPRDFFTNRMLHEQGHMVSDAKWGGSTDDAGWGAWKKAMEKDVFAPSSYGKCAPGSDHCTPVKDDFAETYALYMNVKGTSRDPEMRKLMPERFKILDAIAP